MNKRKYSEAKQNHWRIYITWEKQVQQNGAELKEGKGM